MIVPADSSARVVVLILSVDQAERTLTCLESLAGLGAPPFHVLVWDNGSSDGTPERVKAAHPEVIAHHCERNLGVASGRNAAAEAEVNASRSAAPGRLV